MMRWWKLGYHRFWRIKWNAQDEHVGHWHSCRDIYVNWCIRKQVQRLRLSGKPIPRNFHFHFFIKIYLESNTWQLLNTPFSWTTGVASLPYSHAAYKDSRRHTHLLSLSNYSVTFYYTLGTCKTRPTVKFNPPPYLHRFMNWPNCPPKQQNYGLDHCHRLNFCPYEVQQSMSGRAELGCSESYFGGKDLIINDDNNTIKWLYVSTFVSFVTNAQFEHWCYASSPIILHHV